MTLVPPSLLSEDRAVPPGSTRDAADEALAWACLKDAVTALADAARERAIAAMQEQASEKQAVLDAAGDRLGTVTYTEGELAAKVTDGAALTRWVQENHPSEIVPTVNGAFLSLLLARAVEQARADGVASGEVLPGISVAYPEPVLRITKTKLAREMGKQITNRVLLGFEDRSLGQ
jgi:hypothetical protein